MYDSKVMEYTTSIRQEYTTSIRKDYDAFDV